MVARCLSGEDKPTNTANRRTRKRTERAVAPAATCPPCEATDKVCDGESELGARALVTDEQHQHAAAATAAAHAVRTNALLLTAARGNERGGEKKAIRESRRSPFTCLLFYSLSPAAAVASSSSGFWAVFTPSLLRRPGECSLSNRARFKFTAAVRVGQTLAAWRPGGTSLLP